MCIRDRAIADVARKNSLPTDWRQGWTVGKEDVEDKYLMEVCRVDYNYFDLKMCIRDRAESFLGCFAGSSSYAEDGTAGGGESGTFV